MKNLQLLSLIVLSTPLVVGMFFSKSKQEAREELKKMNIEYTPEAFISTAAEGKTKVVELFLRAGMNPNVRPSGPANIYTTTIDMDTKTIKETKTMQNNVKSITALQYAVGNGDIEMVKVLLKGGADINATDDFGLTPLISAVIIGNIEMVKLLIGHGANVNIESTNLYIKDAQSTTALREAVQKGYIEIIRILIEHGAKINKKYEYGITVLSEARNAPEKHRIEIIQLLKQAGAKE